MRKHLAPRTVKTPSGRAGMPGTSRRGCNRSLGAKWIRQPWPQTFVKWMACTERAMAASLGRSFTPGGSSAGAGSERLLPNMRLIAFTLLPILLLACEERTAERGTSARGAAKAGVAAAPGEGVQWLVGERFAVGLVSSHRTNVIRFWQLQPGISLLDTLVVPALTSSETLVGFYCRLHHTPDPAIVVVAAHTDAAVYTTIRRAWKADTVTGKLIPTSVAGVDCQH